MEKYEKVLRLMQDMPGGVVRKDDPALVEILGAELASYRVPMYMSNIRKKAGLAIRGIRVGRKVVAYQLTALAPTTATPSATPDPEPPKDEVETPQPPLIPDEPTEDSATSDDDWDI